MKPSPAYYVCPDGHLTTAREGPPADAVTCTHPRLGDDTDALIDNADICGKRAIRKANDALRSPAT